MSKLHKTKLELYTEPLVRPKSLHNFLDIKYGVVNDEVFPGTALVLF